MKTVQDVFDFMNTWAPMDTTESWDNCGFLAGRAGQQVTCILVALDITLPVIDEAAQLGAQLIVSHHPVIWRKMGAVTDATLQGQKVMALLERHIAGICMHTNLDCARRGVDESLCAALDLQPEAVLAEGKVGRISTLPAPVPLADYLPFVLDRLQANGLQYVDAGRPVQKIATGCGACGDYVADAAAAGCDTFITSDLKYSDFLDGQGLGLNLIDAGHFPTENVIVPVICEKLRAAFPDLQILRSAVSAQPDRYFVR